MDERSGTTDQEGSPVPSYLGPSAHLLALVTWLFGPLALHWAVQDDFVRENVHNAVAWQLTVAAWVILATVTIEFLDPFIGLSILITGMLLNLIFCMFAAVQANSGTAWQYPLTYQSVYRE